MVELDEDAILKLIRRQAGIVSRRQVLELGGTDGDIERLLRRRVWAVAHRGVYVDHTGPLTWDQRAWAAVLCHAPAVLIGRSALRAHQMRVSPAIAPDREPIEIAVAHDRRVGPTRGVRIRRMRDFDAISQLHARPPRIRLEHAVLLAASAAATEDAAVAVLADACQAGRTTARRLAKALAKHPRLRHRRLLSTVLSEVAEGAHSPLERRYRVQVERAHGLPRATRQQRATGSNGRTTYRDVSYVAQRTVVELDGRLAHDPSQARWDDLDRDLASATSGAITLRLGWGQVLEPCRLAGAVGRVLRSRGWSGHPTACGTDSPVADSGGSSAPDADNPPPSLD
jgi:hypothetical protein